MYTSVLCCLSEYQDGGLSSIFLVDFLERPPTGLFSLYDRDVDLQRECTLTF